MKKELALVAEQEVLGRDFKVYGSVDEPLFVAADVAEWIGHSNVTEMWKRVDENEKLVSTIFRAGQTRDMNMLTEDGLYEVLMQSRKPIAKQFKAEVKKILKSIRTTGGYIAGQEQMDDMELMARALLVAQRQIEERTAKLAEAEERNMALESTNAALTVTNKMLAKEEQEWEPREVVTAIVRGYGMRVFRSFSLGWADFYRELLYRKHINLKARDGGKNKLDRVKQDEWLELIATAAALCMEQDVDPAQYLNIPTATKYLQVAC